MICIGGSQGSIAPLSELLSGLPRHFSPSILITLHRHTESTETLLHMLHAEGHPALIEPYDKDRLSDGAVYLAPPDYHLLVNDGWLSLNCDPPVQYSRPSIDVMLQSVALTCGGDVLVIILSGANSDGAEGAQSLHRRGAEIWVQAPEEAEAETMPRATLERVPSAKRLTIDEMAQRLRSLLNTEGEAR